MADRIALLKRFQPQLRYDSNEQFFADSAEQYAVNPGNELRRARAGDRDGAIIASAVPAGKQPKLTLAFLASKTYANGAQVQRTDLIGVRGRDYRAQYVKLRTTRPELNNRIYGRAAEVNGRLWLQYWLWYFYNDYQLALGVGTHEGDWEMVQLRIGPDGDEPDIAVYAQHKQGEKRSWDAVEKLTGDPDKPIVYVARGSHASYFEAGFHQTEAFYDVADGKRRPSQVALEIVEHEKHAWMGWPGRWGDTTARAGAEVLDQPSPDGPGMKRQWRDPNTLLDEATSAPVLRTMPRAPELTVRRAKGNTLELVYDFSSREPRPRALVVTVNSRNEKGVPPITHTFDVESQPKDTIKTDIPIAPSRNYDVYTSTVSGDPPQPSASKFTEIPAIVAEKDVPFTQEVAKALGGLLARIRGDR